jgi:hypothetical protein
MHQILRGVCCLVLAGSAVSSISVAAQAPSAFADAYARHELLDPASSSVRVTLDVSATTAGAGTFVTPIPAGSTAREVSALDLMTGQPLKVAGVTGAITVQLARPVPRGGETRLRIIATYADPKSYVTTGALITFTRPLAITRNAIVLPAGYEVVACNYPSQVIEETDGRLRLSQWTTLPSAAPVIVQARKRAAPTTTVTAAVTSPAVISPGTAATTPRNVLANLRISERAIQDREIVYFLKQPDTHAFALYHDYTESRPGVATYRNVVRGGSSVSDPSAVLLDTGEALRVETVKEADAEVVIIHFPAVQEGRSARLRITETYTDPGRYGLVDGQLVWNRNFGRPQNDVVLPEGWYLTDSAIPGVITTEPDGRTRIAFINPRPDSIDVVLKARRR